MDEEQNQERIFFIDNLRIFLTFLVILHHTMITYGALGDWYFIDPNTDASVSIFLTVFAALNQGFFMGLFFLLSSYFTPFSYNLKGPGKFLRDRFIRLGIPILIYIAIIDPLMSYILNNISESFLAFYLNYFQSWEGIERFINGSGPLWFTVLLLIFALFYCAWRKISKERFERDIVGKAPRNSRILLIIIIMTFLTFIVRLWYPLNGGAVILNIQIASISEYIIMLILGTVAYKRDWFTRISDSQGRLWLVIALLSIIFLIMLGFVSGAFEGDPSKLLGGFYWESFAYASWESLYGVAMSIGLITLFRNKINTPGKISKLLSQNTYSMYLIHSIVLVSISVAFAGIIMHPLLKLIIVSPLAFIFCFLISHYFLRRIPGATKVLG